MAVRSQTRGGRGFKGGCPRTAWSHCLASQIRALDISECGRSDTVLILLKMQEIMNVEQIMDDNVGLELTEENVETVLDEIRPYLVGAPG